MYQIERFALLHKGLGFGVICKFLKSLEPIQKAGGYWQPIGRGVVSSLSHLVQSHPVATHLVHVTDPWQLGKLGSELFRQQKTQNFDSNFNNGRNLEPAAYI